MFEQELQELVNRHPEVGGVRFTYTTKMTLRPQKASKSVDKIIDPKSHVNIFDRTPLPPFDPMTERMLADKAKADAMFAAGELK